MFEADVHQSNHFLVENILVGHFEGIRRANQAGNDLFGNQAGVFRGRLQVVNELFFCAADENAALLPGFGSLRLRAGPGGNEVTIERMIREVLLEIILGIELQHGAHVGYRHRRQFCVPHHRVAHADSQHHLFGAAAKGLIDGSQMFAQQLRGQTFLVCRRIV